MRLLPRPWQAFALLALLGAGGAYAQGEPPSPLDLWSGPPGEPWFAALERLRAAEATYRSGGDAGVYAQVRAQAAALAGRRAEALRWWDATGAGPDSVGVLPPGAAAVDAAAFVAARADTARVVMVNEAHHDASTRLLTLRLLPLLYDRGYRYFAAEALAAADTALAARGYATAETGLYTQEPVFGEVVREALRLGYTLVPYEHDHEAPADTSLSRQQRRDRGQALNLYRRTLARDPGAKVLVHAGFGHIYEAASPHWHPMGAYFREIAGVDPLTVDQVAMAERSEPAREHPRRRAARAAGLLGDAPVVLVDAGGSPLPPERAPVDVQVLAPVTRLVGGRPHWMAMNGRRTLIEAPVPCAARRCFVSAHPAGSPDATALDLVEVEGAEAVWLALPPGAPAEVVVQDPMGAELALFTVTPD